MARTRAEIQKSIDERKEMIRDVEKTLTGGDLTTDGLPSSMIESTLRAQRDVLIELEEELKNAVN